LLKLQVVFIGLQLFRNFFETFAFLESENFHFQVIALKTGHCIDVLINILH